MTKKIPMPDYGSQAAKLWRVVYEAWHTRTNHFAALKHADMALEAFSERFCPVPEKEPVNTVEVSRSDVETLLSFSYIDATKRPTHGELMAIKERFEAALKHELMAIKERFEAALKQKEKS